MKPTCNFWVKIISTLFQCTAWASTDIFNLNMKIEIFCNNIHYCSNFWGQSFFFFWRKILLFRKEVLNWSKVNIREVFNKCCSFLLFIHQKILQNITDSPKKVLKKCISCTAVCNIAKITIFEFLEDHVRLRTGEMADENVSLLFFKTKTIVQPELQRSLSTLFKSYLSIRNNIHGAVHFRFYCWFSFREFRELFFEISGFAPFI